MGVGVGNRGRIITAKSKSVKSDTYTRLNILPRYGFKIIVQNVHKNVHSDLSNFIQSIGVTVGQYTPPTSSSLAKPGQSSDEPG